MNIIDYHIEEWSSVRILKERVQQKISDGWKPLGGVSVALKNDATHAMTYLQAMIRPLDTQKEEFYEI